MTKNWCRGRVRAETRRMNRAIRLLARARCPLGELLAKRELARARGANLPSAFCPIPRSGWRTRLAPNSLSIPRVPRVR